MTQEAHHRGVGHVKSAAGRHTSRLLSATGITVGFLILEVIGSFWTGSLALLADAGHMFTDVAGLTLSLLAIWFASKPPTPANTYGYVRLEILAALANGMLLFSMAAFILYEAYQRLESPPDVLAGPMLAIALIGLGVNLISMWLLHSGAGESLNLRGAYLEVLGDAVASLGVIVAALIIQLTGWTLVDPIISGGIGLFILPRTWSLMKQAAQILMEGVPPHLNVKEIETAIRTSHGVRDVHDLHVWTLTSGKEAMSAHVLVDDLADGQHIVKDLQGLLGARFGIEHTTIQLESDRSPLFKISPTPERRS